MKLNLRSVDLNLLPIFEAIMETGQFSRAAERLAMSQPALSAAVQRLRATLNDPLFTRTSKGVVPTPRAQALYEELHQGLEQLRHSLAPKSQFNPAHSRQCFRVMSGDFFEFVILPTLISGIQQHSQGITMKVTPIGDYSPQHLIQSETDLLLDAFPIDDDRIIKELLTEDELVVIARQDHPELTQETVSREQFFNAVHVVLPERNRVLPLDKILGNKLGKKRKVGLQVTQYSSLLVAVAGSDFIATIPKSLATQYAQRLNFKVFAFPMDVPLVPIYMMWTRALDKDPAHQWFIQCVKSAYGQLKSSTV